MSDADQDLAACLTEHVRREVLPLVGDAEISALRRYQALDRTYELVNQVLRAERHPDELSNDELVAVRVLVRDLDVLLARWRTPEPVRVYRGMRNRVGFDVDESPVVSRSFLSTTVFRDVAIREFTVSAGRHYSRSTCPPARPRSGCRRSDTLRSPTRGSCSSAARSASLFGTVTSRPVSSSWTAR